MSEKVEEVCLLIERGFSVRQALRIVGVRSKYFYESVDRVRLKYAQGIGRTKSISKEGNMDLHKFIMIQ